MTSIDISIDCETISVETGAGNITVQLTNACVSDMQSVIPSFSSSEIISEFDDNPYLFDALVDNWGYADIVDHSDHHQLLEAIGETDALAYFDSPTPEQIAMTPAQAVSELTIPALLNEMTIDDVIDHFGESAFAHLAHGTHIKI